MRTAILILFLSAWGTGNAQKDQVDPDGEESPLTSAQGHSASLPVQVVMHFGGFTRGGGSQVRPDRADFMFTGTLDFLKRSANRFTWGVGLRLSGDDDGTRVGGRFIYRPRLGPSEKGYWLLATGLTFTGSDNRRALVLPTGFFELDLGHETWGSLSLAVEVVPYRHLFMGFTYDPAAYE